MKSTRRSALIAAASTLVGACISFSNRASHAADGVGPNRGIKKGGFRQKITCDNSSVPVSSIADRLATPEDFSDVACKMNEDSHEGPYFTCTPRLGKSIAEGQDGYPLTVALRLLNEDCEPISDGVIDIWSCNATGHYSGYSSDPDKMPPMAKVILFGHLKPDLPERFCRGALRTDEDGIAEFDTIFPGYYHGVPIHIHFKAHVAGKNLLTTQANLPEDIIETVLKTKPYSNPRSIDRTVKQTEFATMHVNDKGNRLLATLDLIVPI